MSLECRAVPQRPQQSCWRLELQLIFLLSVTFSVSYAVSLCLSLYSFIKQAALSLSSSRGEDEERERDRPASLFLCFRCLSWNMGLLSLLYLSFTVSLLSFCLLLSHISRPSCLFCLCLYTSIFHNKPFVFPRLRSLMRLESL